MPQLSFNRVKRITTLPIEIKIKRWNVDDGLSVIGQEIEVEVPSFDVLRGVASSG